MAGVVSILCAFFFTILGIILGAVAIYMGKQGQQQGLENAGTAVILGTIGLILSIIMIIVNLIIVATLFPF